MVIYSPERKDAILKKLLPPYNKSVAAVAREENISEKTIYNWRKKLKESGKPVPGKSSPGKEWSAEAKLAVIVETAPLSESELGQYCRQKGLYPEQIKRWKQECLNGFQSAESQNEAVRKQSKADKTEIKALKKELRKKEKALAEAAALLVLRKKLRAFYGEETEED